MGDCADYLRPPMFPALTSEICQRLCEWTRRTHTAQSCMYPLDIEFDKKQQQAWPDDNLGCGFLQEPS